VRNISKKENSVTYFLIFHFCFWKNNRQISKKKLEISFLGGWGVGLVLAFKLFG
jgi:hypothetical protein